MSNLFKDLIKINAVKSKNVFLYSKYARDKKINIYKDSNTDVIFIKKKPDNYYYQKKSYEKDILSIKKYKLKNPIKIYDQDNIRRVNYIKSSYNKTILDIGSANSDFLQLAKKNFKIAEGVEPNEKQRKQTPSRTGMRRAQTMKFSTKNIVEDKKSGEYRLSHHLDLKTGMYKGRQVLDPKEQYIIIYLNVGYDKNCS